MLENDTGRFACRRFAMDKADDPEAPRATDEVRVQGCLYINDVAAQYPSLFGPKDLQTNVASLK